MERLHDNRLDGGRHAIERQHGVVTVGEVSSCPLIKEPTDGMNAIIGDVPNGHGLVHDSVSPERPDFEGRWTPFGSR